MPSACTPDLNPATGLALINRWEDITDGGADGPRTPPGQSTASEPRATMLPLAWESRPRDASENCADQWTGQGSRVPEAAHHNPFDTAAPTPPVQLHRSPFAPEMPVRERGPCRWERASGSRMDECPGDSPVMLMSREEQPERRFTNRIHRGGRRCAGRGRRWQRVAGRGNGVALEGSPCSLCPGENDSGKRKDRESPPLSSPGSHVAIIPRESQGSQQNCRPVVEPQALIVSDALIERGARPAGADSTHSTARRPDLAIPYREGYPRLRPRPKQ
jgi:hypothetical protein